MKNTKGNNHLVKRTLTFILTFSLIISAVLFTSCGKDKKEIVIFSSAEDYRIEYMEAELAKQFPDLDIVVEYKSSGDHAALLKASGKNAGCHISHDLDYSYASELEALGVLADLDGKIDFSVFTDDAAVSTCYVPEIRNGGAIIINKKVIADKGLDIPASYEDLLDEQYKGLISMPNPASSGTGYMFLLSLVNAWGEEAAFDYFDKLAENVLSFTTSGSGPVNSLVMGEVAIGLGMTANAVTKINEGAELEILFFEEGSPYSLYGQAVIAGYEGDEDVMKVFEYLTTTINYGMVEKFYPEKVYRDKDFVIENYPTDIDYADMSNNTPATKEALLKKWSH